LTDRIEKSKTKRKLDAHKEEVKRAKVTGSGQNTDFLRKGASSSVLSATNDMDSINYRPKTRESRIAYEGMLSFVQSFMGDQPQDILMGAAEEILSILKDDSYRDHDRHKEVEKILSKVPADKFNKLVNMGKQITDFFPNGQDGGVDNEDEDAGRGTMDEGVGVAVVFDDDDEDIDVDNDGDEVRDSDDDSDRSDDEGDENNARGMLKGGADDMDIGEDDKDNLSVHDIDAHWLQRQLSKYYSDANISAKLAEDTLAVLQISDERGCENKLVVLLDFNKFEFIKVLLRNRAKIYYCTRLKQAQSDAEKEAIEREMKSDGEGGGPAILEQLYHTTSAESWAQDRLGEIAEKARREARALNAAEELQEQQQRKLMEETSGGRASVMPTGSGKGGLTFALPKDEVEETVGGSKLPQAQGSGSEKTLDLEGLEFVQGGHMMANNKCELPDKSWRAQKKGYEEVHVPAIRPVIPASEKLVQISDLPEWAQPAFPGIKNLNRIQTKMMPAALEGSDNILLCAPTGAGKTNVALMCMLSLIGQHQRTNSAGEISYDLDAFKMVYIAPMKALVQEVVTSFGQRLKPFGITVKELSGDQNLTRQQIQETQLIVTTPEKWDIVTRKAGDRAYTQLVRLMIIDEIHLLHDDRGPVLEALVARTVRQVETTREMIRMVGLSATLPNYEDVATFLRIEPEKGLFYFDNSFRTVPLQQQYIGVTEKKALKRFQLQNEICYEKVMQHAGRNQILIFTHSRAETAKTARALRDMALENDTLTQFVKEESASREILREEAQGTKNPDLKDLIPHGFGIHHAGMTRSDRNLVEDLFFHKHVQVLVSTATLAWGVNLPAHTVILKGTQMYSPEQGRWVELSPLDIMQMMGRAGRYGLDSEGEGIIITQHDQLQYYLSLMNQQLPIESQFIKKLPDMLNAEVVLGTVQNIREAATWLGYTYLFVRMLRNPGLYGVTPEEAERDPLLMQRRLDLAHSAAAVLDKHNLMRYDRKAGGFQVTALGRVASHYYVSHESIHVFNEYLKPSMSDIEIFRLFSMSGEFKYIHVREEEKIELAKLVSRVPIPVKEGIEEPSAKVNVLLQAYISRLKLEGFALVADMTYIQQSACRLMRCLFEVALKRGWAALAAKTLTICKMVERRTWGSQCPLRQFNSIPEVIIRKLEKNSDITWDRYYDLKPQDLGEMVKLPKMGKTLHKYVHMFPKVELSAMFQPVTRNLLMVDLTITPDFQFDTQVHDFAQQFWVIVEDVNGEMILHHESFILRKQYSQEAHHMSFTVTLQDPLPPQYFVKVVSDRWLHAETVLPVSFRHILLPAKFLPPTELLDLQPLPVSALRNNKQESLFLSTFRHFNPIQTQTFSALFESDDNALVCAPTGSGKTVCAEFAMLRLFASNLSAKCVYVAPKQDICDIRYADWTNKFQEIMSIPVVKLVGDTTKDLKLLEQGSIIMCTAEQWDVLSRRWKQRKNIQAVSLYIFDEVHLIGGMEGATLEVVASRARYVASQLQKPVRIVALGSSIANAKDVGDWLGVPSNALYNFPPSVRPVPLEIHMHGFETNHFGNRLLSMAKAVFNAVVGHCQQNNADGDKPAIIFVPSRKQSQLTAIDLITYAAASGRPDQFLGSALGDSDDQDGMEVSARQARMADMLSTITEPALAQTLAHGVGFLHRGLTSKDQRRVQALYRDGIIQVLVCPYDLCWSLSTPAHLVVVMETTYYEGREHRFVSYPVTDMMQMLGLASRPTIDHSGKAVILCHAPKKEYLKRLINSPLPCESHIDHFLHDHLTAEIVTKTVENKQDAVDYLTWTFYYRRLAQNPNYYNLQGSSHRHLSDHLSELIENTIQDLEESKCITVEDDIDISPLNLGMISSYYYIQYTTIELFASSVTAKTKLKGIMEILCWSSEFTQLAMRQKEDSLLAKMSKHLPQALPENVRYEEPSTKALVLLQSHFSRKHLNLDLTGDLKTVMSASGKLLQAMVDVISSQSWLKPALAAMELSQMITQGMWDKDSVLLQVPHFTKEMVARCAATNPPIESVFDILEAEDDVRDAALQLSPEKMSDVAVFCNAYPNIDVSYESSVAEGEEVEVDDVVTLMVTLEREDDDEEDVSTLGTVIAPRFLGPPKTEGWWLVVGDTNSNSLLSIKRVTIGRKSKAKLEFSAPENPGDYNLTLYLMSDSYLGCDQEYELSLTVVPGADSSGGEDMSEEE
jgi:pre-mRNA-splicing helicase BRR2